MEEEFRYAASVLEAEKDKLLKPEKPVFVLPVTYQTQKAETGIESLWALYSDGRRSEMTAGLYPNRPSSISFKVSVFL